MRVESGTQNCTGSTKLRILLLLLLFELLIQCGRLVVIFGFCDTYVVVVLVLFYYTSFMLVLAVQLLFVFQVTCKIDACVGPPLLAVDFARAFVFVLFWYFLFIFACGNGGLDWRRVLRVCVCVCVLGCWEVARVEFRREQKHDE